MQLIRKLSSTSNIIRARLRLSTTGQGFTGLLFSSTGLIVSTICDNEATPTVYTSAGSTIETITTLGTYAAPTATKCRLKLVDDTNEPGLVEFQFADARFAVASAKTLRIFVSGVANLLGKEVLIQLTAANLDDGVRGGMSALPNAAPGVDNGLLIIGDNVVTAQNGMRISNANGHALTLAGRDDMGWSGLNITGDYAMSLSGSAYALWLASVDTVRGCIGFVGGDTNLAAVNMSNTRGIVGDIHGNLFGNISSLNGAGAWQVIVHVTDGTSNLAGVTARLYGGATNASGMTDISGNVTLNVDTGTYTLSLTKGGYSYTPTTQTITANVTLATQTMVLNVVTPPTLPTQCTATGLLIDRNGNIVLGGSVEYRLHDTSPTTGYIVDQDPVTTTSNAVTGVVSITGIRGKRYQLRYKAGDWYDYTFPAAATDANGLSGVLGRLTS